MKRLLYILLLVIGWNTLTAQTYQVNNQKIRFMNALGIPAKDTAAANWANAADTSIILIRPQDSTLWYKYKGNFRKVGTGGTAAIVDTTIISTKAYRNKGTDSIGALISPRITDSLRSLVRLRASGSGGIQLQNSNGTNVADFGAANTTNGSIAGGWNVGGNLSVTGTSGFTGKATFSDSIVGVNQRLTGTLNVSSSVGIGTINPSTQLHVVGSSSGLIRVSGASDNVAGIDFGTTASPDLGRIRYNNAINELSVFTNSTERIRISSTGNVGFGTTSPTTRIHIAESNPTSGILATISNTSSSSQTGSQIQFVQAGIADWVIGQPAATNAFAIWAGRYPGFAGTQVLTINSTGAAIFSSSVTSQGALTATAQGNNIAVGVDSSITSTTYTLVLGDAGYLKRCSNASAITITVPTNASVAFPIGTTIYLSQQGAGKVSVSPATSDVTIQSEGNLLGTAAQHAVIGLIKVNTNRWLLVGNRG